MMFTIPSQARALFDVWADWFAILRLASPVFNRRRLLRSSHYIDGFFSPQYSLDVIESEFGPARETFTSWASYVSTDNDIVQIEKWVIRRCWLDFEDVNTCPPDFAGF